MAKYEIEVLTGNPFGPTPDIETRTLTLPAHATAAEIRDFFGQLVEPGVNRDSAIRVGLHAFAELAAESRECMRCHTPLLKILCDGCAEVMRDPSISP